MLKFDNICHHFPGDFPRCDIKGLACLHTKSSEYKILLFLRVYIFLTKKIYSKRNSDKLNVKLSFSFLHNMNKRLIMFDIFSVELLILL